MSPLVSLSFTDYIHDTWCHTAVYMCAQRHVLQPPVAVIFTQLCVYSYCVHTTVSIRLSHTQVKPSITQLCIPITFAATVSQSAYNYVQPCSPPPPQPLKLILA